MHWVGKDFYEWRLLSGGRIDMVMTSAVGPWHYLQISDALDREVVSALGKSVPIVGWQPEMRPFAFLQNGIADESEFMNEDPPLRIRRFPMQKGYAKRPISFVARIEKHVLARLLRQSSKPELTPLICSTPYYAPLAEKWPGPIIYYLTDLMAAYKSADAALVQRLDRQMCARATAVCPNSERISEYLVSQAGCSRDKIKVVPNATRLGNILSVPAREPFQLPADASDLLRPVVGVIGNLAGNLDWQLIRRTIEATPEFSWLFVGPTTMEIQDRDEAAARAAVKQLGGRVRFVGAKPYGVLVHYARGIDVAFLPYRLQEPTFSGSSTRFYEHLAACRPMIATKGFAELLQKEPLLQIAETADECVETLRKLHSIGFNDGQIQNRWLASQEATWDARAKTLIATLTRHAAAAT